MRRRKVLRTEKEKHPCRTRICRKTRSSSSAAAGPERSSRKGSMLVQQPSKLLRVTPRSYVTNPVLEALDRSVAGVCVQIRTTLSVTQSPFALLDLVAQEL